MIALENGTKYLQYHICTKQQPYNSISSLKAIYIVYSVLRTEISEVSQTRNVLLVLASAHHLLVLIICSLYSSDKRVVEIHLGDNSHECKNFIHQISLVC